MEDYLNHLLEQYAIALFIGDEKQRKRLHQEIVGIRKSIEQEKRRDKNK